MSDVKTIGSRYEHEKFDGAIEEAAKLYLEKVMGEQAHTESGQKTVVEIKENAISLFSKLPIEYYQMLEGYIEGKSVKDFADIVENDRASSAMLSEDRGLVALIAACSLESWKVKDPEAANTYYENKFPTIEREPPKSSLEDIFPTLTRKEAVAKAKAMRKAEIAKGKQGVKEMKAMQKANDKAYKAYMKRLKKQDREAYNKLSALHKLEQAEQKKLLKLNEKLLKHGAKFGYLNELQALDPSRALFSEKEKAKLQKLRREERQLLNARDDYRESLQDLNATRLQSGIITRAHYDMRESQLTTFDFTYRAMQDYQEMRAAGQTSIGDEMRAGEAETIRAERETANRQEPVRIRVDLQTEIEEQQPSVKGGEETLSTEPLTVDTESVQVQDKQEHSEVDVELDPLERT